MWERRAYGSQGAPEPQPLGDYYVYSNFITTLKLTPVGTSTDVILPKQLLAFMRVEKGDQLYAIETPNGILLTPYDPEIQEQLEIGERLMDEHRDVFKALAK
jgi:putative addiction module antidote